MRASLHPFLPNGPTGDPALWIDLPDEGRSVLFDLGDLRSISTRRLLRVDRVVVTHTHMDHFVGFDQLLRVVLGRERELAITGPAGFVDQVAAKLAAYTWNLIGDYPVRLVAEEIDGDTIRSAAFSGESAMRAEGMDERPFHGVLHAERGFTIHAEILDHGIPVLGLALRQPEHLAVNKDRLDRLGLVPGPWLSDLKLSVRRCRPEDEPVHAPALDGSTRRYPLAEIASEILFRTPGQSLGYLTDLCWSEDNRERAARLARGVEVLVCETPFLHADEALARDRCHLTARQAGELARDLGARRLAPCHFSPRYEGRESELVLEAAEAFGGPVIELARGPVFSDAS